MRAVSDASVKEEGQGRRSYICRPFSQIRRAFASDLTAPTDRVRDSWRPARSVPSSGRLSGPDGTLCPISGITLSQAASGGAAASGGSRGQFLENPFTLTRDWVGAGWGQVRRSNRGR